MTKAERTKPTIYDIARTSGVSVGTVSRVLNNRPHVAAATRARVTDAAKRLGFMPQQTTRRTNIGVVVQEIEESHRAGYVGSLICELANHAARCGAVLEIVSLKDIERVYSHYLQGLIGIVFGKAAGKLTEVRDIPVLLINNVLQKGGRLHSVATDHADGTRLGTEYLLERGHTRIALVQIERAEWGARERERGYRKAFDAAGIPVPDDLIVYLEGRAIEEAFDPVLRREPTAVFSCGEDLSLAIAHALLYRLKRRIPEDLSLLTYEVPIASYLATPPLTTIAQPWDEMARAAVNEILSLIETRSTTPRHLVLPNRLIERESVRDLRR